MPTTLNPKTETDRVRRYTSAERLQQIEEEMERNVAYYSSQPDDVIAARIEELKEEWSLNRYLQTNVATVGFLGAVLGLTVNKRFAWLTAGAFGFFLFHGIRGWDPPIPLLRRMGIRTRSEIDREIYALKVVRGDFKDVPAERQERKAASVKQILEAVNA